MRWRIPYRSTTSGGFTIQSHWPPLIRPSDHGSGSPEAPQKVSLRTCSVDLTTGRLSEGRKGTLTSRELSLLVYLVQRTGNVVSREELTVRAFGYSPQARTRAVDKAVHGLRRKVEARPGEPEHILTCSGAGYRFVPLRTADAQGAGTDEPLVGRSAELGQLQAAVGPGAVITIKGAPGLGKTRLASALASRLSSLLPAVWIDLTEVRSDSQLVSRMEQASGSTDAELVLASGPRLWILDGEANGVAIGAQLEQWAAAAPDACWIRTAEAPLTGCDQQIVVLAPLTVDDAARLFRQRAARRGYALPDSEAVRQLVGWLDGLPLAVALAADRIGPLGVADLVQGLETRELDLLTWPPRDGGAPLWDRLEASWARVGEGDQHLLESMVRFDVPIQVSALVDAVGWPRQRVLQGVERLVDASWLYGDNVAGHTRLRMIRPMRQFVERRQFGEGPFGKAAGLYSALPPVWSTPVSRSSSALLLKEALTELEATGPRAPSGPAVVTLVELLAPVVHTRVSRVLLRHAAHRPKHDLRQDVEDQVQVVFAKLFADRGRILRAWDPTGGLSLANWVGRFAQLRTSDAVRHGMRGPWLSDPVDPAFFDEEGSRFPPTPEDEGVARTLWTETRRRVLAGESEVGRHMFTLLFDEERSVDDIVTETKRSRGSILKWRSRLRQSIRRELKRVMSEGRHDEA